MSLPLYVARHNSRMILLITRIRSEIQCSPVPYSTKLCFSDVEILTGLPTWVFAIKELKSDPKLTFMEVHDGRIESLVVLVEVIDDVATQLTHYVLFLVPLFSQPTAISCITNTDQWATGSVPHLRWSLLSSLTTSRMETFISSILPFLESLSAFNRSQSRNNPSFFVLTFR